MKLEIEIPDALLDAIAERVAARMRELVKPPAPAAERYVTRRQAAAPGVSVRALVRAERAGKIEAFRPGDREVVYRRDDVLLLVERTCTSKRSRRCCPSTRGKRRSFERSGAGDDITRATYPFLASCCIR